MEQVFNKLVRDKIPEIIEKNGEVAETRILDDNEYIKELYKKLLEETNEVVNSNKSEETLEELADVFEVIKSIAEVKNKEIEDIAQIAKQKRFKRGGFKQRIFLEKTYKKPQ